MRGDVICCGGGIESFMAISNFSMYKLVRRSDNNQKIPYDNRWKVMHGHVRTTIEIYCMGGMDSGWKVSYG